MEAESLLYSFVARENVIISHSDHDSELTGLIMYGVLTDEAAGRQIPFAFLERIKEVFTKTYGGGKASETVILNIEFGSKLKEQMQYFVDNPEEIRKLAEMKRHQVIDVKSVTTTETFETVMHNLLEFIVRSISLKSLGKFASFVLSADYEKQLTGTTYFKILLTGSDPPISSVIESGVVPCFVEFLKRLDKHQLQIEAATVLTKIVADSEYTKHVVELNAIPLFVNLLRSSSDEVRSQAMFALGYIAGASTEFRDTVIEHGVLDILLKQFDEKRVYLFLDAFWALTQFWNVKPLPHRYQIKPVLSILNVFIHARNVKLVSVACSGILKLSECGEEFHLLVEMDLWKQFFELLKHKSMSIVTPVLKAILKMVGRGILQVIIDHDGLPGLLYLLTHGCESEHEMIVCYIITGITSSNRKRIQAVLDAGLMSPIVQFLKHHDSTKKRDAAWIVANVIFGGTKKNIRFLVGLGCIGPLCDMLMSSDLITIRRTLEAIGKILKLEEANNGNHSLINDTELMKIRLVQEHIEELGDTAARIIDRLTT